MPVHLKKVRGGWKVAEKSGATPYSKKPQSKATAARQMAYINKARKK